MKKEHAHCWHYLGPVYYGAEKKAAHHCCLCPAVREGEAPSPRAVCPHGRPYPVEARGGAHA